MSQAHEIDAGKEYVIRGNSALVKCQFPSFMAEHLHVESWLIDESELVAYPPDRYGIAPLRPTVSPPLSPANPVRSRAPPTRGTNRTRTLQSFTSRTRRTCTKSTPSGGTVRCSSASRRRSSPITSPSSRGRSMTRPSSLPPTVSIRCVRRTRPRLPQSFHAHFSPRSRDPS